MGIELLLTVLRRQQLNLCLRINTHIMPTEFHLIGMLLLRILIFGSVIMKL